MSASRWRKLGPERAPVNYVNTVHVVNIAISSNRLIDRPVAIHPAGVYLRAVEAFETMANLATKAGVEGRGVKIVAPLMRMSKAEIISWGQLMGVDYALTSSCYDPAEDGAACGACDSCAIRRRGFAEAGVADPTRYGVTL